MKRLLIVAPHHDDEIIGCGGTILHEIKNGSEIFIVVLTSGSLYRGVETPKIGEKRSEEAIQALNYIGIPLENIFFLKLHERDNFVGYKNVALLARLINELKITDLFFPHNDEQDMDHKRACQLAEEALFLSRDMCYPNTSTVKNSFKYEVWTPLQSFQKIVNISNVAKIKHEALKKYISQDKELHIATGILGLNRYRGFQVGCVYAEVYKTECI